jgi:hypothetical protein
VKIVAEGETAFCADKSVRLKANNTKSLVWNNGETNTTINVNKTGEYFVRARNEFGCEGVSQSINVRVYPKPETPFITPEGPTLICADKSVKLTSNISNGITWNTGDRLASLLVFKSGEYSVMARNEFGCESISNIISIKVNPLPPKPSITPSGPTIFCDGDNVSLTAPESHGYIWSNAKSTRDLTISSSGFFSVKTIDRNGCISPNSNEIEVIVKPSPIGINVLQSGTFTLEVSDRGLFDVKFEWYKDNILLPNTTKIIKPKTEGVYTVKGSIMYQLGAGRILRCFSPLSNEYEFKIDKSMQGLSIFPNPAPNSIINIETLEDLNDAVINIYNFKGTLLKSYDVPNFDERRTFDLSEIHRGSFLINVKAKDFNVFKRVYIE